jgi:CheY-like chemotaxis protein
MERTGLANPHDPTQPDSPRGRVLIVDDTPANLALLAEMLINRGYDVSVATNGQRALALVDAAPPDLIMLDVAMPDMDGYEVCRRLQAHPSTAWIPIIFLSAHDEAADKIAGFKAGGRDYVTKPFHVEEVMARVETQLTIARLTNELTRRNEELARRNEELLASQRRTAMVFAAFSDLLPGQVLDGKYVLGEKIGAGGFGTVFRAKHIDLERAVAVKVFRPAPGNDTLVGLARFRAEGVRACRLEHPNIVAVLDSGTTTDGGIAYLVMELLEGRSLAEEMAQCGSMTVARCLEIAVPVCRALAEAASRQMVHRDIKPSNVFLHHGRDGEVVKLVDFGIAKLFGEPDVPGEDLTVSGGIVGSPAYMSPERLLGDAYDDRSDVYSVGVMIYQMLSGRMPFEQKSGYHATAVRSLVDEPVPLAERVADLPSGLEVIIMSAIARDARRRPTAASLETALLAFASRSAPAAHAAG